MEVDAPRPPAGQGLASPSRGGVAPPMSRDGELAITGRRIHRQCLGSTANAIRTLGGCSASAV